MAKDIFNEYSERLEKAVFKDSEFVVILEELVKRHRKGQRNLVERNLKALLKEASKFQLKEIKFTLKELRLLLLVFDDLKQFLKTGVSLRCASSRYADESFEITICEYLTPDQIYELIKDRVIDTKAESLTICSKFLFSRDYKDLAKEILETSNYISVTSGFDKKDIEIIDFERVEIFLENRHIFRRLNRYLEILCFLFENLDIKDQVKLYPELTNNEKETLLEFADPNKIELATLYFTDPSEEEEKTGKSAEILVKRTADGEISLSEVSFLKDRKYFLDFLKYLKYDEGISKELKEFLEPSKISSSEFSLYKLVSSLSKEDIDWITENLPLGVNILPSRATFDDIFYISKLVNVEKLIYSLEKTQETIKVPLREALYYRYMTTAIKDIEASKVIKLLGLPSRNQLTELITLLIKNSKISEALDLFKELDKTKSSDSLKLLISDVDKALKETEHTKVFYEILFKSRKLKYIDCKQLDLNKHIIYNQIATKAKKRSI